MPKGATETAGHVCDSLEENLCLLTKAYHSRGAKFSYALISIVWPAILTRKPLAFRVGEASCIRDCTLAH